MGRISKCHRYAIDVTALDLFGGVRGAQCFDEFGACGRARTMKIGRRVRDLYKLT